MVLDDDTATQLDHETGTLTNCGGPKTTTHDSGMFGLGQPGAIYTDSGGPSRFFPVMKYQAKAPQKERPSYTDATGRKIAHPTVKPRTLLSWLVRLVTPPDGLIVDPFAGSGTTLEAAILEGFRCVGVEQDATYLPLIMTRIQRANEAEPAAEGMFEAPVRKGRWPANVAMDRDTATALDQETGESTGRNGGFHNGFGRNGIYGEGSSAVTPTYRDTGGGSRFFPVFDTDDQHLFNIDEQPA